MLSKLEGPVDGFDPMSLPINDGYYNEQLPSIERYITILRYYEKEVNQAAKANDIALLTHLIPDYDIYADLVFAFAKRKVELKKQLLIKLALLEKRRVYYTNQSNAGNKWWIIAHIVKDKKETSTMIAEMGKELETHQMNVPSLVFESR